MQVRGSSHSGSISNNPTNFSPEQLVEATRRDDAERTTRDQASKPWGTAFSLWSKKPRSYDPIESDMASTNEKKVQTLDKVSNNIPNGLSMKAAEHHRSRDVSRGVWELARFHTREAWLCWYPAGLYPPIYQNQYSKSTYIT